MDFVLYLDWGAGMKIDTEDTLYKTLDDLSNALKDLIEETIKFAKILNLLDGIIRIQRIKRFIPREIWHFFNNWRTRKYGVSPCVYLLHYAKWAKALKEHLIDRFI